MRHLELNITFFKTKTPVITLLPGEKKIIVRTASYTKGLTIVLARANHLKFNTIFRGEDKELVINTDGFDSFWIERPGFFVKDRVTLCLK